MKSSEIISRTRKYLGDIPGVVWSDSELLKMLSVAARRYAEATECFRRRIDFYPEPDGKYYYPEDFIRFIVGWNSSEEQIKSTSRDDLKANYSDYSTTKGLPEFIYNDLDNPDEFRLCPNPADIQAIEPAVISGSYGAYIRGPAQFGTVTATTEYVPASDYGTVSNDDYGIMAGGFGYGEGIKFTDYEFAGDYGISSDDEYGEVIDGNFFGGLLKATEYAFTGDMVFACYGEVEKIKDYMALVFSTLEQAYNTDSDFADSKKAAFYKQEYRKRINIFGQVVSRNTGITNSVKLF